MGNEEPSLWDKTQLYHNSKRLAAPSRPPRFRKQYWYGRETATNSSFPRIYAQRPSFRNLASKRARSIWGTFCAG